MPFLLAAALCSVLVSVLLKLARRLDVDVGQAIAWNYVVAAAASALVFAPAPSTLRAATGAWPALAGLGLLLPTIFLALAGSVRHAGIVRSEVAQRLSLLISLLAAFVLFGEPPSAIKGWGIAAGLGALVSLVWRPAGDGQASAGGGRWTYPLLVFLGFGVIDVLFKRVAGAGVPLGAALLAMFSLALLVSIVLQGWRLARGRANLGARSLAAGLLLGLLNFGNILFYLRAHQALPGRPALVFAGMNLGVVGLGALAGLLVFRERLSRVNLAGLGLAVVAIALLARG
ncbi:EamA/RhaT family transporter [Frateuria edaphi]|jgi:drug/metabolite transporter (DMT)-like permease|uniref:EamA family transporter n=1 Tax=Frateuria edaphi TaxID=2898793 RepID=UPI001E49F622|nr:EamA/RhaT family transporter [Frateuria edaphi]UGB45685.1 EamA/RhaT family transporter [Frateuria edaphi]